MHAPRGTPFPESFITFFSRPFKKKIKTLVLLLFLTVLLTFLFPSFSHQADSKTNSRNKQVEKLQITTDSDGSRYLVRVSLALDYPVEKCRSVLEDFSKYPQWAFAGINKIGGSSFYRIRQKNFQFVSRDDKEFLVFEYDITLFIFHFKGTLEFIVNKASFKKLEGGNIYGKTTKSTGLVKKIAGQLSFRELDNERTFVSGELTIKPSAFVLRVVSLNLVGRAVGLRVKKISTNLNGEILKRNLFAHGKTLKEGFL